MGYFGDQSIDIIVECPPLLGRGVWATRSARLARVTNMIRMGKF